MFPLIYANSLILKMIFTFSVVLSVYQSLITSCGEVHYLNVFVLTSLVAGLAETVAVEFHQWWYGREQRCHGDGG